MAQYIGVWVFPGKVPQNPKNKMNHKVALLCGKFHPKQNCDVNVEILAQENI